MSPKDTIPDNVVFSLICLECDAGMDIVSYDQALSNGWTRISNDPEGLAWNCIGLCPDCRRAHDDRDRQYGTPAD